ncbi:major facilitator superfamily domain-containing protein [Aspergillus carlsbadensis]|nr:major facilitator superfamily domain-containing protein [Aspergillus carlsbadensis]
MDTNKAKNIINECLAELDSSLRQLSIDIHEHPELAYEEHYAHDTISTFVAKQQIDVTRSAYGVSTAFEATTGTGGRCVNFNAEFDALPELGHACGHNLIAMASVAGFLALRSLLDRPGVLGRAQLLGTPAEEDGGGKIDLLNAGAYKGVDVSLMIHPMSDKSYKKSGTIGASGQRSIACFDLVCTYTGVSAHAGANPWEGVNALDAVVAAYNNISMLRQQIEPQERIHGTVLQAPKVTNAIPASTVTKYTIRSPTMKGAVALGNRVRKCLEAGAVATGCEHSIEETPLYADLRINEPLCEEFRRNMEEQGERLLTLDADVMCGSTDQGNVSYAVPALHGIIGIPVANGAQNHTKEFCDAARSAEAHEMVLKAAAAMAMTGWAILTNDAFYSSVRGDDQSPVSEAGDMTTTSTKETRRVLWRIDFVLLPLLGFCYLLQFLDKQSLNYASLLGILEDVHLVGDQYSWCASIFYLGFIFWSYPTAYLSVRLPIGKYLSCTVILWAAVLMCHAACTSFATLMVTRFILGALEAAIAPGFSLVTAKWYTRKEQPLRYGIWFSGSALASLFGGVASYGIGHIHGSLSEWQYLFIIFGAVTCLCGIMMLVLLPDSHDSVLWLRKPEQRIAAHRVTMTQNASGPEPGYQPYQVLEAFRDPTTWFLALYTFCVNIANGGLTAFGSLVIQGFGYEGITALLIQMPTGAAQLGFIIVSAIAASYIPNARTLIMLALTLTSLVGMVLMYALDNSSGQLAGFCLALAFSANMPISLSLVTSNICGATKRATVNACVLVMYCVGNVVGPQFFSVDEAPDYPKGVRASLAGFSLGAFWVVCLRVYLVWKNRWRNSKEWREDVEVQQRDRVLGADGDLTDWEIPGFRYVL